MNKKTRELLKKNNQREKEILEQNKEIYTDIVVYLRGSDISEYNQEVVREDIINMILEGQMRGDSIETVVGGNYKEFCDEIIAAMPKKTRKEKILDVLSIAFSVLWILGGIAVIEDLIRGFLGEERSFRFILSLGDIVNAVVIAVVANIIVCLMTKNVFKVNKLKPAVSFLIIWLVTCIIIGLMVLSSLFLKATVLNIPLIVAAVLVVIVFGLNRLMDRLA